MHTHMHTHTHTRAHTHDLKKRTSPNRLSKKCYAIACWFVSVYLFIFFSHTTDHMRNLCAAFGITDMFAKIMGRRHLPHAYKAVFEALVWHACALSLRAGESNGQSLLQPQQETPMNPYGR